MCKLTVFALVAMGCATAPKTAGGRQDLEDSARVSLEEMQRNDPGLRTVLDNSYGFAIFPSIGKGGALVGGAYGRGIVYEHGRRSGYVELNQASFGAQLGAQTFAELIVFQSPDAARKLREGSLSLGADANVVVLKSGAAAAAQFQNGLAVFVQPRGGLMVGVTVTGQKFNFQGG